MTEPVDAATVVARADQVHWAELDGEGVLLDQDNEQVHRLNTTATAVWVALDGSRTVGEVGSDLARDASAPTERVVADVVALVADFVAKGLGRVVG